ncbi:hypothetical protein Tco_1561817 [Tanacetum coccineum]
MGSSSTSQNTQNIAFVSSNITGNTNEAVKTAHDVSAANSKVNASILPNVDSLSDAMIYSFFAMQMAMLTNESKKDFREVGRNLGVNGTVPLALTRPRETTRRTMPIEETTSNALVSQCDGFGYDWSDQAKEGPTNFALMAYTSSSSSNSRQEDIQVSDKFKTGVGYDSQVFDSQENDKYKTSEGYHAVPPPYTRNFMPSKPDLELLMGYD